MDLTDARSIFSPATGYIQRGGFDWTCNPYVGCTFGCTYCYAMFLPQNRRPREDWGRWFVAKTNALELARRQGPKVRLGKDPGGDGQVRGVVPDVSPHPDLAAAGKNRLKRSLL